MIEVEAGEGVELDPLRNFDALRFLIGLGLELIVGGVSSTTVLITKGVEL